MGLEARLVQKLGQSLLMTPQLQQAIKLLQLGRLEYKEALERELLENPVLEESREEGEEQPLSIKVSEQESQNTPAAPTEQINESQASNKEETPEWEEYLDNLFSESKPLTSQKGLVDFEDRPSVEATLTKERSLADHLIDQLRVMEIDREIEKVLLYLIGNLDDDGYLCVSDEEIIQTCNSTPENLSEAVAVLQTMDPPGIGARDVKECLLIQLDNLGLGESLAAKIVREHLDKVESRKFEQIMKVERVPMDRVSNAISTIRDLEPKPGRPFNDETVRYAIPDIYVYKVGNDYVVSLNEDGMPKLRVSPFYLDILKNDEGEQGSNKAYLNERLKAATFLIKSIHQRQQTILKVTQSIVRSQREFLDKGIDKLKPLTLKDVAEDIGMHESTVSRVTTNKYVHTPQGVFELKYFFTTGIRTAEGDVSSSSIKERIKKLIAEESSSNPISDQQIVERLSTEGIEIARRTVAKYRESLGILSSSRRKQLF